ncbi:hypothetical protein EMCRGX_G017951 [Ephydatia muelleri]
MKLTTESVKKDNATWQSHLFSEYDVVIGLKRAKWSRPRIPEHPSVLISKDTATNKACQANWLDLPDEKTSDKRQQSPMDSSVSFSAETENMRRERLLGSLCRNMYFLMDGSDLDDFCLWIYSKRTYCCDKEVAIENLLEPNEANNSIPCSTRR